MTLSVSDYYAELVAAGAIAPDPAQSAAVAKLFALEERLAEEPRARKSSALGWMFGNRQKQAPPKGLYIYGKVGRGKTMLMDLFFEASAVPRKRRVHFHEFMAEVHERIHDFRQKAKNAEAGNGEDAVARTGAAIAAEARLLCFDEFHVTDIADAMILGRLFAQLFDHGTVVVATSNVAPDELYKDGLNRALFLPFIGMLHERMDVVRLDARTGQVSVCAKRAAGWACLLAPDERTALETEISRLQGESAKLKREMIARGLPLPSGMQAPSRAEHSSEIIIKLPSEAELDRMREFAEKVLRRFRGMVQELRRELNKKD